MKFFADTANVEEIKDLMRADLIQGVTTNPTLIQRAGRKDFRECIAEICDVVDGPVSAEVTSLNCVDMIDEGRELAKIAPNVVVKLTCDLQGMMACKTLSDDGIDVNMTLAFSVAQYTLAANAGAKYVSPFIGRLDDIGEDGITLIDEIYASKQVDSPNILAASIRSADHINQAIVAGADCVTIPPKLIWEIMEHKLTIEGIEKFQEDWDELQKVQREHLENFNHE
jgi:transaldolase|tara:strand:- start:370 stop:1047 length:678 start_codon:yes stop_codon:yes gene_type:complete